MLPFHVWEVDLFFSLRRHRLDLHLNYLNLGLNTLLFLHCINLLIVLHLHRHLLRRHRPDLFLSL